MDNFGLLLDEWRVAVQEEAADTGRPPLLLTAAVYYVNVITTLQGTRSYPAASINQNLDWVNVMNYDYVTAFDVPCVTGAHAALYNPGSNKSTSYGMNAWIGAGVASGKLVMGLPLYGRIWMLADSNSTAMGAPANDNGGPKSMPYDKIARYNKELGHLNVVYDNVTVSVYSLFGALSWVGYDDVRSVEVKINYAQQLGLRGYFFWEVIGDYHWELSGKASELWN